MRSKSALVVAAALVLGTTVACGVDEGEAGGGSTVQLFGLNSLSGQSATIGLPSQQGAQLKVDEVNGAGGLKDDCGHTYKIKLSSNDMQVDSTQAVTLARQAAQGDSVAIIGPTPSVGFVPLVPLVGQLKIPLISAGSSAPIKEWNKYAYRDAATASTAEPPFMSAIADQIHMKRVAIVFQSDNDYQVAAAKIIEDQASDLGYEVVADEGYPAGQQDFQSILTKVKAATPDAIAYYGAVPEVSKLVDQADSLGIKAAMFGGGGAIFRIADMWDLTNGAVNGAYTWSSVDINSTALQDFVSKYKTAYNQDPTDYSVQSYDAVGVILAGIKKSCSPTDRGKLADALSKITFDGINGTIAYDQSKGGGENLDPVVNILQVTGRGTAEVVDTVQ